MNIKTDEEQFSEAFAEFTSAEPVTAGPNADPAKPAAAEPAATEPAAAEPAAAEPTAKPAVEPGAAEPTAKPAAESGAAEPAAAEPAAAEPAAAEPAASAEPAKHPEMEALRAEVEALRAAQPRVQPAAEELPPVYTADEETTLTKYQEDWPDIAKGEALLRRAEYKELVSYIFQQVQEYYAPAVEFLQKNTGRNQYNDIVELVPDYPVVRDKAIAWAEAQPAYLKAAYAQVISDGTPQDVADMIARYKKETGYTAPAGGIVVPAVPLAPAALRPAAAKAAAALAVVKSTRSEQIQGADENDFEGAFKEFAAIEEAQAAKRK